MDRTHNQKRIFLKNVDRFRHLMITVADAERIKEKNFKEVKVTARKESITTQAFTA